MYLLASASSHAAWAAASTSCTSPSPPPRQNARSAAPSSEFNIRQVTPSYQSRSSCGTPPRGRARDARRWKGKPSGRSQRGSCGTSPGGTGERNVVLQVFEGTRVDLKMWRGRGNVLDLNTFHSDLVRRVVGAGDGFLPIKDRHFPHFSWLADILAKPLKGQFPMAGTFRIAIEVTSASSSKYVISKLTYLDFPFYFKARNFKQ